jgi:hypothetical protein
MLSAALRRTIGRPARLIGSKGYVAFSTKVDSFLSGSSSVYVEQMYDSWLNDPNR